LTEAAVICQLQVLSFHGDRPAINHAPPFLGDVQQAQDQPAQRVEGRRQLIPAALEAGAGWLAGKQVAMLLPLVGQLGPLIPAHALAHQRHGEQFTPTFSGR
jgi:hypothetical protein